MGGVDDGRLAVVEFLVGAGASVNAATEDGHTALHFAAWFGQLDVVEFLVGAGADVDAETNFGWTPRDRAVSCTEIFSDEIRAACLAVVSYFDSLAADG